MILSDFHIHTRFCDGHDEPKDIVREAIARGMKRLGFSGHAYTPFDAGACMSRENTQAYLREIRRLKEKYSGQIEILCGTEMDYYSEIEPSDYDYLIGSVHYVKCGDEYLSVDHTDGLIERIIHACNDDPYEMVRRYYALVADVVNRTGADIIGHFDLITKLNSGNRFFDEDDERYVAVTNHALDTLLETGRPFEINTGAMSRGYKLTPYPSERILKYIAAHGESVILSSDAHDKRNLMYGFEGAERLARRLGLKVIEL